MFIVSCPELVVAQCTAGVVGAFPALNARPQALLDEWLTDIRQRLDVYREQHPDEPVAPFAVNQIVHRSNSRLQEDLDTCVRHQVPIVITSLQPPGEVVAAVHAYGGVVFHDVINLRHAHKAIEQGVDGLIAVCAGAGGHGGTLSPFALVKELRREFDGTVILSGAMSNGADILAAEAIGADLAYFGTRFIAAEEANAADAYKGMIVEGAAADIVYTPTFTGVHGNYLKDSVRNAGLDPDALAGGDEAAVGFDKRDDSAAKVWRDIWSAGQGVGSIDEVLPARELVLQLETEYRAARARFGAAAG